MIPQKEYCMENRCKHAIHYDGYFDECDEGHKELPLNEDGDIGCPDYEEAMPDDYEEDIYDGRELE